MQSRDSTDRHARDAALIERLRVSDTTAMTVLMQLYAAWLAEVAYGLVHSVETAQDVVQDVFTRLWDIRSSLHIQGSVAAYLYRMTHNRALNVRKQEQAQHALVAKLTNEVAVYTRPASNAGELAIDATEQQNAIDRALRTLQPRARDIFLMRMQEEMSYEDIASACQISVATAYKQVYLATRQLAQRLSRWTGLDRDDRFVP